MGDHFEVAESLSVSVRYYLSGPLLDAARAAARRASDAENAFSGVPSPDSAHRGDAMAAILFSWAFIEAAVNELGCDAAEDVSFSDLRLPAPEREVISKLWSNGLETCGTLQKYQAILAGLRRQLFERGAEPFQSVDLLRCLRNLLVHSEPKTFQIGSIGKLEAHLRAKFAVNKRMEQTINPFFPDKCLGAGCAEWASRSADLFVAEFRTRAGISLP